MHLSARHARNVAAHPDETTRVQSAYELRRWLHPKVHRASDSLVRALVTRQLGHSDACPRVLAFCNAPKPLFDVFVATLERWRGTDIVHGRLEQTPAWNAIAKLRRHCWSLGTGRPIAREALLDGWLSWPEGSRAALDLGHWLRWYDSGVPWQLEQACRAASDVMFHCAHPGRGHAWREFLTTRGPQKELVRWIIAPHDGTPSPSGYGLFDAFFERLHALWLSDAEAVASLPDLLRTARLPPTLSHLAPILRGRIASIAGQRVASGEWSAADVQSAFRQFVEKPLRALVAHQEVGCETKLAAFLGGLRRGRPATGLLEREHGERSLAMLKLLQSAPRKRVLDPADGIRVQLARTAVAAGYLDPIRILSESGSPESSWMLYCCVQTLLAVHEHLHPPEVEGLLVAIRDRLQRDPGSYASAIFATIGAATSPQAGIWATRWKAISESNLVARPERELPPAVIGWILEPGFSIEELRERLKRAQGASSPICAAAPIAISSEDRPSVERGERYRAHFDTSNAEELLSRWAEELSRGDPYPSGGELALYWSMLRRALRTTALANEAIGGLQAIVLEQASRGPGWLRRVRALTTSRESLLSMLCEAIASANLDTSEAELVMHCITQVRSCRIDEQPLRSSQRVERLIELFHSFRGQLELLSSWEHELGQATTPAHELEGCLEVIAEEPGWPKVVETLIHNVKNRCSHYERREPAGLEISRKTAGECLRKCRMLLLGSVARLGEVTERAAAIRDAVAIVQRTTEQTPEMELLIREATVGVSTSSYLLIVEELVRNAVRYASHGPIRIFSPYPFDEDGEVWEVLVVAPVHEQHRTRLLNALGRRADDRILDRVALPRGSSGLGLANIQALAADCHTKVDTTSIDHRLGVGLRPTRR